MKTLTSGSEWLGKLQAALVKIVTFMALLRYERMPDADDRVADALAALVEGANRFEPQPGRDSVGYFLQYTLSYVAGALRNGASIAKGWSDEAVTFSDLAPEAALGIERVWETLPGTKDEEPGETLFVLNNGKVASTPEIIELITGHEERARIASKHLGLQVGDKTLPVRLLQALDGIALGVQWLAEPDRPAPVVTHDLDLPDVVVMEDGIPVTFTAREAVEMASRGAVPWLPEQGNIQCETDDPWPSWVAGEEDRAYRSPYANDNVWPARVDRALWVEALEAWAWADVAAALEALALGPVAWIEPEERIELGLVADTGRSALEVDSGEFLLIDNGSAAAVETMMTLAVALAGETEGKCPQVADAADGSCRRVAGALAFRVKGQHYHADKQELYESFCSFFGVDGTRAWTPEQPSANGLQARAAQWVAKVAARRDVWPSQAAAIRALVLNGASPREAKRASQAAYRSRRPAPQVGVSA